MSLNGLNIDTSFGLTNQLVVLKGLIWPSISVKFTVNNVMYLSCTVAAIEEDNLSLHIIMK